MVKLESINNIYKTHSQYDKIYFVVNNLKTSPDFDYKQMKNLAPSNELSYKQYNMSKKGMLNKYTFNNWYTKEFLNSVVGNTGFVKNLGEILEEDKKGNVAIVGFGADESLSHRSIIGGILKGFGADVHAENDYDDYFYEFVSVCEDKGLSLSLTEQQEAAYAMRKYKDTASIGFILDSDNIDDFTKNVLNESIENNKFIFISNDGGGVQLKEYLDNADYENYYVMDDIKGKASGYIMNASKQIYIASDKSMDRYIEEEVFANNLNDTSIFENMLVRDKKYFRFYNQTDNSLCIENEPEAEIYTKSYSRENNDRQVKSDMLRTNRYDITNVFSSDTFIRKAQRFADFTLDLLNNSAFEVKDIFDKPSKEILSEGMTKVFDNGDTIRNELAKILHNFNINSRYKKDLYDVEALKNEYKRYAYDGLAKNLKASGSSDYSEYEFDSDFMTDFSNNNLRALSIDNFNLESGFFKLRMPCDKYTLFDDIEFDSEVDKKYVDVTAVVDETDDYYSISFGSASMCFTPSGSDKSYEASRPMNTIYLEKGKTLSDGAYMRDAFGEQHPIVFSSDNMNIINAFVYINSSNPDIKRKKGTASEYIVGSDTEDKTKDGMDIKRSGYWTTVRRKSDDGYESRFNYVSTTYEEPMEDEPDISEDVSEKQDLELE